MTQITEQDFEFFSRLLALDNALTFSVVSPVVLKSELHQQGLEIMRKRVSLHQKDITKHLRFHSRMLQDFDYIEDGASRDDRESLGDATIGLCTRVRAYVEFVEKHILILGEDSFFEYPTCLRGHYFQVRGYGKARELFFNPDQDKEGVIMDIDDLEGLVEDFKLQSQEVGVKKISKYKPELGFLDTSYKGKFNLTVELLKRIR